MPISGGSSGAPLVAANSLFGNFGTVAAPGSNIAIGANITLSPTGTLSAAAGGGGGIGTIIAGGITNTATSMALPFLPIAGNLPTLTTWLNQNGATITQNTNGPLVLFSSAASGNNSWSCRYKAVPVGAFDLQCNFSYSGDAGPAFALMLTDGTQLILVEILISASTGQYQLAVGYFTDPFTFSTNLKIIGPVVINPIWGRIVYDGASTYSFYVSVDGFTWLLLYTTASLPLTPTGIGIAINTFNNDATVGCAVSLNYWAGA